MIANGSQYVHGKKTKEWNVQDTTLMGMLQYWVVYAFLTVIESAINAVYWFPFYYTFKFILVLWMALPQTGYVSLLTLRRVLS